MNTDLILYMALALNFLLLSLVLYLFKERFSLKSQCRNLGEKIKSLEEYPVLNEEKNQEIKGLMEERVSLKLQVKELETRLENERQNNGEKIKILSANREFIKNEFKDIASIIIEEGKEKLLNQNSIDLKNILTPFREQVESFRKRMEITHETQIRESTFLKQELSNLKELNHEITKEASNLTKALRGNKKTQGNWGEMILESVLEKSGLEKNREYIREVYFKEEEGIKRPDVIINLPDGRHIVIDSKVSLNAYLDFCNAETKEKEDYFLKEHIKAIRNHITTLSKKDYSSISNINSPDMVFMFMPVEPAFYIAFKNDESISSFAFEKGIVLVTPTTLLATLKTVANLWRIEKQNQSARELFDHASKVYDKLVIFLSHFENIGKQIEKLNGSYSTAMKNLSTGKGNLISLCLQFKEFGFKSKKEISDNMIEKNEA